MTKKRKAPDADQGKGGQVTMNNDFLKAEQVAEILSISQSKAYVIIRQLNKELQAQGYLTIRGRLSRQYLLERYGRG